jgi:hypothetical protein
VVRESEVNGFSERTNGFGMTAQDNCKENSTLALVGVTESSDNPERQSKNETPIITICNYPPRLTGFPSVSPAIGAATEKADGDRGY